MAPAMQAMKAKAMKSGALTPPQVIASVADTNDPKNTQVTRLLDSLLPVARVEINNANPRPAGTPNSRPAKKNAAIPARKSNNPFTKVRYVFKAKAASKFEGTRPEVEAD